MSAPSQLNTVDSDEMRARGRAGPGVRALSLIAIVLARLNVFTSLLSSSSARLVRGIIDNSFMRWVPNNCQCWLGISTRDSNLAGVPGS